MTLIAGTQLGHYQILSPLGKGGMGEVYLAEDTRLRRKVAIKLLPSDLTRRADAVHRFEQEAQAASALNHPNILTIYEVGQESGAHYIATEFIDGQTLRERLKGERLSLTAALDIAIQTASALAAAHEAKIIHRDIKPENIMLRRDGIVKVLDFGLAKLTEQRKGAVNSEAETLAKVSTGAGAVLGTPQYMSPEQARGLKVDARTDIFSLGAVLYELVTGHPPFDGVNALEVVSEILQKEPAPLRQHLPEAPRELEQIVTKALRKERDERYQTSKDLLIDLKDLRRELEFAAEERRRAAKPNIAGRAQSAESTAEVQAPVATDQTPAATTVPSVQLRIPHSALRIGAVLAAIVLIAIAAYFYFRRAPVLTERDTVLLADFENKTGDAVFDGTLKQALAVHLGQSPFLNLFADERVRETLRMMERSPDEAVTREIGREICQRQGLKAMLIGSIASLGRNYVLNFEAINGQTGDVLAREQAEAEGKEQVLRSLGEAATRLREKLGESLGSIQQYGTKLEQATTSSLDALKAYSLALEHTRKGKFIDAASSGKRAIELDPNFALAYSQLAINYGNIGQRGLGEEAAQKAFALRERGSEREKLDIAYRYYLIVTGEIPKAIETLELIKQTYPRYDSTYFSLGNRYASIGQFEKAVEEFRERLRRNPTHGNTLDSLTATFIRLNRYEEAKATGEQAVAQKYDAAGLRRSLYLIAFIKGDAPMMQQQVDWASARPGEYAHLDWQADAAAFTGQLKKAWEFNYRAADLAQQCNLKEVAGDILSSNAEWAAVFGNCRQSREEIARAAAFPRIPRSFFRVGMAMALCGDAARAQALSDETVKRYPKNTIVNEINLPLIQAALELQRGNRTQAIQILQAASRYESVSNFYQNYLRGQAYLGERKGAEAASEFQKILDHRGWAPASPLYPLAYLGLARAAAISGDVAKARKAYEDFFTLWKDADAELPILLAAKQEYARLK